MPHTISTQRNIYTVETDWNIGQGKFGIAYKGRNIRKSLEEVAAKCIREENLNSKAIEQIEDINRTFLTLNHKNLVKVLDLLFLLL